MKYLSTRGPTHATLTRTVVAVALLTLPVILAFPTPRARITISATTDALEGRYHEVIVDTLSVSLERAGYTIVNGEEPAELELRVEAAIYTPRIHLAVSAYDIGTGALVVGTNGFGRTNVTLLNSLDELFAEVEGALVSYASTIEMGENPYAGKPVTSTILFTSEAKTRGNLRLVHGPSLGRIEEGNLEVSDFPITTGSEIAVLFERPGAYPKELRFEVGENGTPLGLPELEQRDRVAVQLHYTAGKLVGAGAGVRFYALPDLLFASLESDLFYSGVLPKAPHSVLHNEYRFLLGVRIGTPGSLIKFDVSSGAGILFSLPSVDAVTPYLDPYVNALNGGLEIRLGAIRPFLRAGVVYALGGEFAFLESGVNPMLLTPSVSSGVRLVW